MSYSPKLLGAESAAKHAIRYKGLIRALHGYPDLTAGGQGFSVLMGKKMNWKIRIPLLSQNLILAARLADLSSLTEGRTWGPGSEKAEL